MKIFIPGHVSKVLDVLYKNGYDGYIAGGCVRDALLGIRPHDYDICTDCKPDEMLKIFKNFRTIETGLQHGTITVLSDGDPIEITTYRSDGEYTDHRRPEKVVFETRLEEDLKRRDFTVNAMCYNERVGLVDLFGGREDLKNKIIRCVGEPEKRFDEDALRILRGIRFASVLGFSIDPDTKNAILKMRGLLNEISAERKAVELQKLLCGKNSFNILMEYRDVIGTVIPEIIPCFDFKQNNIHHCYDVYEHICRSVSNIRDDWRLRMVMLLHDIGKPAMATVDENGVSHFKKHQLKSADMAKEITRRLKLDNKSRKYIYDLVYEHDNRIAANKKSVRRFMSRYDYEFTLDYIAVRRADTLAQSEYLREEKLAELDSIEKIAKEIHDENLCFKISDLAVNGSDIITEFGFKGREIGETLKFALDAVITEKVGNTKQEIIEYLKDSLP